MTTVSMTKSGAARPDLAGRTVVVLGGSSGIGLETARLARQHGAEVVVTARDSARVRASAKDVDACQSVSFDLTDPDRIEDFFDTLPGPIDHVLLSGSGPYYTSLAEMDFERARRDLNGHILVVLAVARYAAARMRMSGSLLFIGGSGSRRPRVGLTLSAAMVAALPPLVENLALELAPIRVNLIGHRLESRRAEPREFLPTGRLVGQYDVASLAVDLMTNTAITGATYDIDAGPRLVADRAAG